MARLYPTSTKYGQYIMHFWRWYHSIRKRHKKHTNIDKILFHDLFSYFNLPHQKWQRFLESLSQIHSIQNLNLLRIWSFHYSSTNVGQVLAWQIFQHFLKMSRKRTFNTCIPIVLNCRSEMFPICIDLRYKVVHDLIKIFLTLL